MQGSNKSSTPYPKPKDGTQQQKSDAPDANWFGISQEPQEEFIENDPSPNSVDRAIESQGPMSEGTPTMGGSKGIKP